MNPKRITTLKGLHLRTQANDATPLGYPLGLKMFTWLPKVGAPRANLGLNDAIPLGLTERGIQLVKTLAFTLTLSPRRGNPRLPRWSYPGPFVPSGGNLYVTNATDTTSRFFRAR